MILVARYILRSPLCAAVASGVSWRKRFLSQKYLKQPNFKYLRGRNTWFYITEIFENQKRLLGAVDIDIAVGRGGEGGAQLLGRGQRGRAQQAV